MLLIILLTENDINPIIRNKRTVTPLNLQAFTIIVATFWLLYERLAEMIFNWIDKGFSKRKSDKFDKRFKIFKRVFSFAFAYAVGLVAAFVGDITIFTALNDSGVLLTSTALILVDKILLTPLIFCTGTDMLHLVLSFIQRSRDNMRDQSSTNKTESV